MAAELGLLIGRHGAWKFRAPMAPRDPAPPARSASSCTSGSAFTSGPACCSPCQAIFKAERPPRGGPVPVGGVFATAGVLRERRAVRWRL